MNDHDLKNLLAGCVAIYTEADLKAKLLRSERERKPLRIKLGLDPTAPDIHLGHSVVLRKMRQFQDLGHKAVLIIGDFTARIGDPTGRSKTRPVLTDQEIEYNAQTYLDQAGRILDTADGKLEIRRNSEWLAAMRFDDVVRLAARMTVGQLLKREDFRNRFEAETPISLHELLYPLVQGWDSVCIQADVELGGTDQTYNNLVGRQLQSEGGGSGQVVMVMPMLRGLDGVKKMSKSLDNYIGIRDAATDYFGKTMSIPDSLISEWFRLLTDLPETAWQPVMAEHPMKAKALLAKTIGARFHGPAEMAAAEEYWMSRFSGPRTVESVPLTIPAAEVVDGKIAVWKLAWYAHGAEISKSDARRMVENGAVEVGGQKVVEANANVPVAVGLQFKAGRHRSGPMNKQPLICVVQAIQ